MHSMFALLNCARLLLALRCPLADATMLTNTRPPIAPCVAPLRVATVLYTQYSLCQFQPRSRPVHRETGPVLSVPRDPALEFAGENAFDVYT